jgi:stalled ribosome alternative rescue factor ArfA
MESTVFRQRIGWVKPGFSYHRDMDYKAKTIDE